MNQLRFTFALASIAASVAVHADPTVFDQPTDLFQGFASQNDFSGRNGNFATCYDNFSLGTNTILTGATWVGVFFNGSPTPPSAFTLQIWSDGATGPNASLYSTTIPGSANETANGNVFDYSAAISFSATAGTTYWLSIVPDLGFPPQWGWETSAAGDALSYQDFFGTRAALPSDLAFTLQGHDAVPEPAPFMAMGLGLGALILNRRKKA